ncbi:MAG: hypothetical protein WDZ69_01880 [Candidatus Pacearchaeota archaeon]
MKVYLGLSEEARNLYKGNLMEEGSGYMSSRFLASAFVRRGHDLRVVHPSDLFEKGGNIFTRHTYSFRDDLFRPEEKNSIISGDVFFVYSLDEERPDSSQRYLDFLYPLEKQVNLMLNSAESTSYEHKPKQKTLNLPWIPDFDVRNEKDLTDLLDYGERIIAKPKIGSAGNGIHFLEDIADVSLVKNNLQGHLYERFVPANEERRYIFLDNQFIIGRRTLKEGAPGKEEVVGIDLMEGDSREIDIARGVVNSLDMFFCSIDFRDNYLLEINGSGTGIAPPTVNKNRDSYNLSSPVVQAVERKFENGV